MAGHEALPALLACEALCEGLLQRTARWPKHLRQSLTLRVEQRALDCYEGLVDARFARGPAATDAALARVDGALNRLRVLLRLAHRLLPLPLVPSRGDSSLQALAGGRRPLIGGAHLVVGDRGARWIAHPGCRV